MAMKIGGDLRILRGRVWIRHKTPVSRIITEEYTLINEGKKERDDIILYGHGYRPGMRVMDCDGTILGVYTNQYVKEILSKTNKPKAKRLLEEIEKREKYIQWINFPLDNFVDKGETRVVRLSYVDVRKPEYTWDSFSKWLFNIPEFEIKKYTPPTEGYPTSITVVPPSNCRVIVKEYECKLLLNQTERDLSDEDHFHLTISEDIVDVNVPAHHEGTVQFRMVYEIHPRQAEERMLKFFVLCLIILPLMIMILKLSSLIDFVTGSLTLFNIISGGITLLSLAFVGFTTSPLTYRTKYWATLSLFLGLLASFLLAI
ncbi:MAG: hypothetical protein DRN61_02985 [Thaumarchaeota archaeon]|nr:MAG: hypothetical protein DRN61_02985 [Nitrososphaerota archaeon]